MPQRPPDPVRVAVGRYAYACRADVGTAAARDAALRELKFLRLQRDLLQAINDEPTLSPEQWEALAAVLTGGAVHA